MACAIPHEVAHGLAAYKLGDPTAKQAGRLTLNPLAHLDTFGSLMLPLLMALAGGPIFAFAKPVPYNPNNLRKPVRDEVLVALAGPACNLVLACLGAFVYRLLMGNLTPAAWQGAKGEALFWLVQVIYIFVYVNLMLAFFNLIPLPPLDGSSIASPLLRGEARRKYYEVQRYAMPILLVLLYMVPMFLKVDPVGAYLDVTAWRVFQVLMEL